MYIYIYIYCSRFANPPRPTSDQDRSTPGITDPGIPLGCSSLKPEVALQPRPWRFSDLLGLLGACLSALWEVLGPLWGGLGVPWGVIGISFGHLGAFLGAFRGYLETLRNLWTLLGVYLVVFIYIYIYIYVYMYIFIYYIYMYTYIYTYMSLYTCIYIYDICTWSPNNGSKPSLLWKHCLGSHCSWMEKPGYL